MFLPYLTVSNEVMKRKCDLQWHRHLLFFGLLLFLILTFEQEAGQLVSFCFLFF